MADTPPTLLTSRQNGQARRIVGSLLVVVVGTGLAMYFISAVRQAREAARQTNCRGHLCKLQLALQNYHDVYGSFPPAYVADGDGRPMHSWRTLILPFLDGADIYAQYRFDEPWNSRHNSRLAQRGSNASFHCPSCSRREDSPLTDYVVVTGSGTAFPGAACTTLKDIQDGLGNTILVVEMQSANIAWTEPRDLAIDQMSFVVNDPTRPSVSSIHPAGPGVVFADQITAYRIQSLRPATLKALLTIAGSEAVSKDALVRPNPHSPYSLAE
jgi:hypothetical protein